MEDLQFLYLKELAKIPADQIQTKIKELESLVEEAEKENPIDFETIRGLKLTISDLRKILKI